jgi:hypothetical protein
MSLYSCISFFQVLKIWECAECLLCRCEVLSTNTNPTKKPMIMYKLIFNNIYFCISFRIYVVYILSPCVCENIKTTPTWGRNQKRYVDVRIIWRDISCFCVGRLNIAQISVFSTWFIYSLQSQSKFQQLILHLSTQILFI